MPHGQTARRQKGIGVRKHDQVNALFATRRGAPSACDVLPDFSVDFAS
jgi:hypothetical protein